MVAVDLALALAAIATRTLVAELVRGAPMNRDGWAVVAADVVDKLVTTPIHQPSAAQRPGLQVERLAGEIEQLAGRIEQIPVREFELRMAAGRRFLRDLPAEWRTDQQRAELIRDARAEFVRAAAGAELMKDPRRQALAEVAIAGCWLWVPSLPDVKTTVAEARRILEAEILFGSTQPTAEYADVLTLCRSYGERSARNAAPLIPGALLAPPTPGARLSVAAVPDAWVECAGIELKIGPDATADSTPVQSATDADDGDTLQLAFQRLGGLPPAGTSIRGRRVPSFREPPPSPPAPEQGRQISVEVRNTRDRWIALRPTPSAVIAQVSSQDAGPRSLPSDILVAPGVTTTVTLNQPTRAPADEATLPSTPAVGFVLPQQANTRLRSRSAAITRPGYKRRLNDTTPHPPGDL